MKRRIRRILRIAIPVLALLLVFLIPYYTNPSGSRCALAERPSRTVKSFDRNDFGTGAVDSLQLRYGRSKILPAGYELQALLALSFYPELKDVKVRFVIGPHVLAPASSRPTILSSFRPPKEREYLVFIDTDSDMDIMDEILIGRMPFNAQIGLIAHELGHTADYLRRNTWGMIQVLVGNASTSYMNDYEYQTDQCAIAHGAGYQLLAWSEYVYEVFNGYLQENPNSVWQGMMEAERYMYPETIRTYMREIYQYPE